MFSPETLFETPAQFTFRHNKNDIEKDTWSSI